jgi:hypothetical protein
MYFAIGLLLLIVITFGLMLLLLNVMDAQNKASAGPANPMLMNEIERLPPEPRLQSAPGFGIDSEQGRVVLELTAPQSEYRELKKQWDDAVEHGLKDPSTGSVTSLPISEAKERLLQQNLTPSTAAGAEDVVDRSRRVISDSSSGRAASELGN